MSKIPVKFITGIIIALCFGVALFIRIYFPYEQVFGGEGIKFTGVDVYFQMRLIENLVHNFPHIIQFDPYLIYPVTGQLSTPPFFHWLLGGTIWMIGLGSPSQHLIDVVGIYFPAILGALTVVPVYIIGRELFGRWAGLLSAGLLAVLPGEFLGRSILGFTDYHVAEVLITTILMMFFIMAVKTSRERQLTLNHLKHRDRAISTRPLIYSLLAGICLGIYFYTWQGALFFAFIITVYFIVQFIIDHLNRQSTDYLLIVGTIVFFINLIMFLPSSPSVFFLTSLIIALLTPIILKTVSWLMTRWQLKPAYYPLALLGLGLVGAGFLFLVTPSVAKSILGSLKIFIPVTGAELATMEMQPIFFPSGYFTAKVVWGNFTTSFFIGLAALLYLLVYRLIIKHVSDEKNALLVWSLIILAATFGQRRFAYYLAVNAALLTGYLSWQFLKFAGFREARTELEENNKPTAREAMLKKRQQEGFRFTTRHINMALAVIIIFFIVIFPNISPAVGTASQARFTPSDAWVSSLTWLKENTPEPFGDSDFYYQRYEPLPPREEVFELFGYPNFYDPFDEPPPFYQYPETAYGVMSWWDYGYWITRIGRRIPNSCPGPYQARADTARFFLSQDEDSAQEIRRELNSQYIIIDYATATSKFWALTLWAEEEQTKFFDIYLFPQGNQLLPVQLYYPEYYRSLSIRLYNFDGKAVIPEKTRVLSYEEKMSQEGVIYKIITNAEEFASYEEAEAYLSSQESDNYRIVNDNPFISPIPLDALEDYQLVHSSGDTVTMPGTTLEVPEVKIFESLEK
ncbi:oligosaccharyl transferase, archaeosortase A system-associated [Chloroflexota bacterium]